MGCGALLVTDEGNYPAGMADGSTMLTYRSTEDAKRTIKKALEDWSSAAKIAASGYVEVSKTYNKDRQWRDFLDVVERL